MTKFEKAILLWENGDSGIERIKLPIDSKSKTLVTKVYESVDTITLVKECMFNGISHLMVSDERFHVKILEDNETKLKVVKDSFVSEDFYGSNTFMKKFSFNNGMMYDNEGAYMLAPRTEARNIWDKLLIQNVDLEASRSGFPLVT